MKSFCSWEISCRLSSISFVFADEAWNNGNFSSISSEEQFIEVSVKKLMAFVLSVNSKYFSLGFEEIICFSLSISMTAIL